MHEGPTVDKPVGPEKPVRPDDGPQSEDDKAEAMSTPAPVAREHWITSARSSSGYKGVVLERSSGRYRIKHKGNTIARRDTLQEACEYYYNWSVANGLIKDFRLV